MPLAFVKPGQNVRVKEIRGGRTLLSRLANMGIYPGVVIKVISNVGRGPIIISKDGVKLGIGFGMAYKILVEPDLKRLDLRN